MCPDNLEMCPVNLERVWMIQKCVCMIWKVFAFSDSDHQAMEHKKEVGLAHGVQHLLVPGLQKQRLANID